MRWLLDYVEKQLKRKTLSSYKAELEANSGDNIFDMHYSTPSHWLRKTIDRYNASHDEKLPRISFHDLRHNIKSRDDTASDALEELLVQKPESLPTMRLLPSAN